MSTHKITITSPADWFTVTLSDAQWVLPVSVRDKTGSMTVIEMNDFEVTVEGASTAPKDFNLELFVETTAANIGVKVESEGKVSINSAADQHTSDAETDNFSLRLTG